MVRNHSARVRILRLIRFTLRRLLAVNGISLVIAIIANLALLLNMARRISFTVAQPITIFGWYISSILLIALVAAAPSKLQIDDPYHIFSGAFYYAIMAAVLYFTVSSLMVLTVFGVYKGNYSREFKLTMSQRTLMIQTISFLVYLLAGAAVFSKIEGWRYLDTVYWADVTLLTVGFGDMAPGTHLGRSLLFPYAIGGILVLGLVIGSIRSLVLERGKKKMSARMMEKTRERAIQKMADGHGKFKSSSIKKPTSDMGKNDTSERERRAEEFRIMREIQAQAATTRQWTSLSISALAWLILWTIGAVVFWKAEHLQEWTYFESLYFSYVALLTIGYGDLHPQDDSGKAFFVFWSLLAVPTMTVLISNMGGTIVKGIRDVALWVGELTVLPGDMSMKDKVKQSAAKASRGKVGGGGFSEAEPVAAAMDGTEKSEGTDGADKHALDRVTAEFEASEERQAIEAARRGDWDAVGKHHYHYLLMREINHILPDINQSPPRRYAYDEWAWFLKLMGEDESGTEHHRVVDGNTAAKPGRSLARQRAAEEDDQGNVVAWSWIGENSPLMGVKDEAEWVLERLALALEQELRKERDHFRKQLRERGSSSGESSRTANPPKPNTVE